MTHIQRSQLLLGIGLSALMAAAAGSVESQAEAASPTPSPSIVIDQFGYLPGASKIAILRQPVIGFDAGASYQPGNKIEVVNEGNGKSILAGPAISWQGGVVDPASGDRVWTFDFSSLKTPGTYYVADAQRHVRSPSFRLASDVYAPVLKAALRMLYYQRAGFPKDARFAGAQWADGPSHIGPGQDREARLFSRPDDPSTRRDLHGGWYDAGDYNRYTSWAARDVVELLHAYLENPHAFTDDEGIPESGNGVPDILDEIKWELDWLVRMQNPDGSMLSILGVSHASPPSAARGPSYYGPPNTISALAASSAFALGSRVYGKAGFHAYARDLASRARAAWSWAVAHPAVTFRNNDEESHSVGLGAGQQETDDAGRAKERLVAAVHLFDLTGRKTYRDYVDTHYRECDFIQGTGPSPYNSGVDSALVYYAELPSASRAVATEIREAWLARTGELEGSSTGPDRVDAYLAFLPSYDWGSNSMKAEQGTIFTEAADLANGARRQDLMKIASGYVHYLHGVDPLGKVYLSNMASLGATNSVRQMYHSWFGDWAAGPPPGYLVGGPDPHYTWDPRCPQINSKCGGGPPSPPAGEPPEKSYADLSTGWPIDSWQITEPDIGYQAAYIRLLSTFVH